MVRVAGNVGGCREVGVAVHSGMLLVLAFGCAEISRSDAERILDDNVSILAEVHARLEGIETLVPTRHGSGDGDYVFDGPLYAMGANFTDGDIRVLGTGSSSRDGGLLVSELQLTYTGVLRRGARYDGSLAAALIVDAADEVEVIYAVDGRLDATGDLELTADMDWTYRASSSDGGVPNYAGEINGRDLAR